MRRRTLIFVAAGLMGVVAQSWGGWAVWFGLVCGMAFGYLVAATE